MKYNLNKLNSDGQLIKKQARIWMESKDPDIQEAMFELLCGKLQRYPKAFAALQNRDLIALEDALSCLSKFKADNKSRFDELCSMLNTDLVKAGGDRYELKLIQDNVCLERRIGLKASILEANGADESLVQKFFLNGHAQAMLDVILIPELNQLLNTNLPKEVKLSIKSDMTNKYRANAVVQIQMSMSYLEDPEVDLAIPLCMLNQLDVFMKEHPIYF